ncbi:MAG: zinc-finger domain-containing protein [Rhodospirillales bacterium]|jgi:uncharacterized Zn-finger protein|nr:zinc-finger domain-containing protein [Rhodospirillales bacterium]
MKPQETVTVESNHVSCDGGGSAGHPRIYLEIGPSGKVVCPYCARRFVLPKSRD